MKKISKRTEEVARMLRRSAITRFIDVTVSESTLLRQDLRMKSSALKDLPAGLANMLSVTLPSDAEFIRDKNATVSSILEFLELHLGPEFPDEKNQLRLTEDQFITRYEPELDYNGTYYRHRDWSGDEDVLNEAVRQCRCWTMIEDDNEQLAIVSGDRYVNALYHIVTRYPLEDPTWYVVAQDKLPYVVCRVDWLSGNEAGEDEELPSEVTVYLHELDVHELNETNEHVLRDHLEAEFEGAVASFTYDNRPS